MNDVKIYRSIDSLPLFNFIKINETDDLRYLIILDYYDILPDISVEDDIWQDILLQVSELNVGDIAKNYIASLKYLLLRRSQLNIITDCIFILNYEVRSDIIEIIEKNIRVYKPDFCFKMSNKIEYYDSLRACNKQVEAAAALINMKTSEFNSKYKAKGSSKINYYNILTNMQQYFNRTIDPKSISTRMFFSMLTYMNSEIKKQKVRNGRR
jgi:hypothetical protein